ncbi:hypothetical protein D3C84_1143640 [compost metagenome]
MRDAEQIGDAHQDDQGIHRESAEYFFQALTYNADADNEGGHEGKSAHVYVSH